MFQHVFEAHLLHPQKEYEDIKVEFDLAEHGSVLVIQYIFASKNLQLLEKPHFFWK